jgi:nucleotide-binding universal stress UspA family protein
MSTNPVLVGVDGSPSSVEAADVAGGEAAARDVGLVLLHIGQPDDRVFDRAIDRVRLRHPAVEVSTRHIDAATAPEVLAGHAATGCLLVVGHRPPPARGIRSVAQRLVDLVTVPMVVYRPVDLTCDVPEPRRVLVGVAPQGAPDAVLEFALSEASRRRAPLDVLCAIPDIRAGVPEPLDATVTDAVQRWFDKYPDVSGRLHVRHGIDPAIALMVDSHTAQLVVVGSHATNGAQSASVAHALVHRAACPVAVVPTPGVDRGSHVKAD